MRYWFELFTFHAVVYFQRDPKLKFKERGLTKLNSVTKEIIAVI